MSNFVIIEDYRETKTTGVPTLVFDDKDLVNGLQALGVTPLFAETNGSKLRIHFPKDECQPMYVHIQKALAGIFPEDPVLKAKLEFIAKYNQAEAGWRHKLAMMRNVPRVD